MKRILPALWLLFFLLAALPARSQEKLKPFTFTPQWTAQAQFAGYYVALELGFYAEEGLDVKIEHPSSSESAFERIRNERSDATTLQLVQAMEIVDM
ncbi:MAG: ABC transporter substrate-binding protein, partial [Bacteroidales bacterium]|nr:ABC transporter substrate-binding protein [Bacteroidales bacterium]